jgi:hypothetical protein
MNRLGVTTPLGRPWIPMFAPFNFASIFHPASSVTKVGDDGDVGVTPIALWLAAVRTMNAPKQQGLERHDQIVSIDVERELALLKLKLQFPPRYFTDMLSCLKVGGTWKIVQKVMTVENPTPGKT